MLHFNALPLKMISLPVAAAEFLLTAPPACAKVYLYGLIRKDAELDKMAHELSLSRSEVLDAIDCLQNEGLIQIGTDAYTQVLYRPTEPEAAPPSEMYGNANFNAMLQALFADRELSYRDYKIFYECVDVYGLSEQVVLILAEYCINSHRSKNRVPISYIRENARQWAKEGITTMELATQKV